MGYLDQWVYFYQGRKPKSKTNFKIKNNESVKCLFYWRLHDKFDIYMDNLYHEKGGKYEFINQKVWLSKEDILNLREEILNNKFFYDVFSSYDNEEQKNEDLEFCCLALEKIEQGFQIYYTNEYQF